jgi:hypothetical protein
MGKRRLILVGMLIAFLLIIPVLASADAVPWNSQSYSVWAKAYTTGEFDSASGPSSALASVDSYCCGGGWEDGYSYADGTILEVAASTEGAYAYSQAYAEFTGTYIAPNPTFLLSYDLTRNYTPGVVGNWGTILIQDNTTSSTLFSWEGLLSDSDVVSVSTPIGNEIYVNLSIEASASSGSLGLPEVNSATLNYTVAVVPEPISSILFFTGGAMLGGRRLLKRKA